MPTLFVIKHALSDLFDTRQELIDQVAFTDEQIAENQAALDAVDAAIVETVTAEVRKVDNIARLLIEWRARREAIAEEMVRLGFIHDALERNEERLKGMVLEIMRDCDVKKLEGKIGTLRRQQNGGVQGVDIRQPELVPEKFQRATVTLERSMWEIIKKQYCLGEFDFHKESIEPDLTAIGEALCKRVPCPACAHVPGPIRRTDCVCGGEGTVPGSVPGCVLKEKGEHLRVS